MNKKIIYISDFFLEQIKGGGELVDDCLMRHLEESGYIVEKKRCSLLQKEDLKQDAFFIVSNFVSLPDDLKKNLENKQYAIFEHDHKYIIERNPSSYPDFQVPPSRLVNISFYRNATAIFAQSNLHASVIKKNIKTGHVVNLGCSLWSKEHLNVLRNNINKDKCSKYAVLDSDNPVKGRAQAQAVCKKNNLEYDLIGSSEYERFIEQLSYKKGLVFFSPQVLESFCRLVVEARILGCELITNKYNGCTSEKWFKEYKGEELLNFIEEQQDKVVQKVVEQIEGNQLSSNEGDITVILNSYRRPYNLNMQLQSIRRQTTSPKEVWLWVNAHEDNKNWDYSELGIDKIFNNDYNWKFYGRFAAALLADTEYIAIFDDDTIPGKKWFESCLEIMKKQEGILGSAGVLLKAPYYVHHDRCGWPTQNEATTEVDLVGHAWFFKREWLQYLWREKPTTWDNGEDIQFSYLAQKYGNIKTFCPPHPAGDIDLYGSVMGNELGIDVKATSTNSVISHQQFFAERDAVVQNAIKNGWKTVNKVKL